MPFTARVVRGLQQQLLIAQITMVETKGRDRDRSPKARPSSSKPSSTSRHSDSRQPSNSRGAADKGNGRKRISERKNEAETDHRGRGSGRSSPPRKRDKASNHEHSPTTHDGWWFTALITFSIWDCLLICLIYF